MSVQRLAPLVLCVAVWLVGSPARGQTPSAGGNPEVSWTPASPVEGALIVISVRGPGLGEVRVRGRLAGEPLHFVRDSLGTFRAFAGIPIGAARSLRLPLVIEREAGQEETLVVTIPVTRGSFAIEKLSVAPEFGWPPDPATAARVAAETERAREVYRRSHLAPPLWDGAFARPMASRVTSGFGHAREFNGEIQSRHLGVDFDGVTGTPVKATNRGVVALVDEFYYAGRVVYLNHGAGLVTAYMHLSGAEVAVGDTVAKGQVIGRVGATGRVTGPHLHWIARYGQVAVDPLSLIALGLAAPPRQ